MKTDKETVVLVTIFLAIIAYVIYGQFLWKYEPKSYAIGYVYDAFSIRGAGPLGKFYITVNGKRYEGTVKNGFENINKHFIVEFISSTPRACDIAIEKSVNYHHLTPQPPEGWTECPINEDGSIKEKFRAKNYNQAN